MNITQEITSLLPKSMIEDVKKNKSIQFYYQEDKYVFVNYFTPLRSTFESKVKLIREFIKYWKTI